MTLPCERYSAINRTRDFLLAVMADETVPDEVRKDAYRCIKHYPGKFYMEDAKEAAPDVFGEVLINDGKLSYVSERNKTAIWTVTAYRWNDTEKHSYVVGVYDDEVKAFRAAIEEECWRAGKYGCRVIKTYLNYHAYSGDDEERQQCAIDTHENGEADIQKKLAQMLDKKQC